MVSSVVRWVTLLLLSVDHAYSKWNSKSASQRQRKYRFFPRRHRLHSTFFATAHNNNHDPFAWPDLQDLNELATDAILDQLLDQILDTSSHMDDTTSTLIHPYHPSRMWLWRQWKTTIFHSTIPRSVLPCMAGAWMIAAFLRKITHGDWNFWIFPSPNHPTMPRLRMIQSLWKNIWHLTTLVLVLFVNQSLAYWRSFLAMTRALQETINDIHVLLATHAKRNKNGTYTREAQRWLQEMASLLHIYPLFHWATMTRQWRILWTEKGLARLVARGILSIPQKEMMERRQLGLTETERHYVLLEWMIYKCQQAQHQNGALQGGPGLEQSLLEKACMVRTLSALMPHKVNSRMPVPYIHLVQVLVDSYLVLTPLALYPDFGIVSVVAMGILTLFYGGLMDLSKVLLDPLNNDQYHDDDGWNAAGMHLTFLLRECHRDSTKWMNAARKFPK